MNNRCLYSRYSDHCFKIPVVVHRPRFYMSIEVGARKIPSSKVSLSLLYRREDPQDIPIGSSFAKDQVNNLAHNPLGAKGTTRAVCALLLSSNQFTWSSVFGIAIRSMKLY